MNVSFMFGQMRSRKRNNSNKPCPCGGICNCHKPQPKEKVFPLLIPLAFPLLMPGLLLGLVLLRIYLFASPVHIMVNGQDCIVQHVNDYCHSWGTCSGHNVAICPSEK
jgi:hypothetical protein